MNKENISKRELHYDIEILVQKAEKLGYKVTYTSSRPTAANFQHKEIYISQAITIDTYFSLAHEIGHCIDNTKGNFNINKYKTNKLYRVRKEVMAWYYGYSLLNKSHYRRLKYWKHAYRMLKTYVVN